MKIYTKTGDEGQTGLGDGSRVGKDHPRVAAYGDVDELNAAIGAALAQGDDQFAALLGGVQKDLFAIGAQLADPRPRLTGLKPKATLSEERAAALEQAIDEHEARLPPLKTFILPAGTPLATGLHLARTICRRAERAVVALGREEAIDPEVVIYLNRLSDLLFVLARRANQAAGRPDVPW
jgi:cob(I)alamin adenosyltransferase